MAYSVDVKEYDDEATKLFRKIMLPSTDENDKYVMDKCITFKDGPLHPFTIQKSTVLHLVCYFEQFDLASKLLNMIQENDCLSQLINTKNDWGSTVLHDAASATDKTDEGIAFIEELMLKVPMLLPERNELGETAVFSAVRYGNKPMFNALMHKVITFCNQHYQYTPLDLLKRPDGFTVLHLAIITRQFDLAFQIAKEHKDIRNIQHSVKKTTALLMLGRNPTAFDSGTELGCLYKSIDFDTEKDVDISVSVDTTHVEGFLNAVDRMQGVGIIGRAIKCISRRWKIPCIKRVIDQKMERVYALELAKLLISTDQYWDKSLSGEEEAAASSHCIMNQPTHHPANHPLFSAARNNCNKMVKEILKRHPQAVDYLNPITRENLLHIAVKSRNRYVIDHVIGKKISLKGQLIAIDNNDNCLLHMVGCRPERRGKKKKDDEGKDELTYQPINHEDSVDKEIKSPVTHLSEELKFKEYIEEQCPSYMRNLRNKDDMTADELFAHEKEDLRIEAKEYLKNTSTQCTVVIVLIATVAFAAAYTVPGGPDDKTGFPHLLQNPQTSPLFLVFAVTDVLSLGFALTAVVVFLTILTSEFKLKYFRTSLPRKLLIGLSLLFLSVSMMMISFAATIIITIQSKKKWTKIALYIVAFSPVLVFMLSYVTFYRELFELFTDIFSKIGNELPKSVKRKSKTRYHHTSSFNTV